MIVWASPGYSLVAYVVVATLAVLGGQTILRLFRAEAGEKIDWFRAPILWSAAAIVVLATASRLGVPTRFSAPAVLLASVLLAVPSLRYPRPIPAGLLATCLVTPIVVERNAFWAGLPDYMLSSGFDVELYIICARAYWEHAPSALGDSLGPMYQVARSQTPFWRFGASSLLSILSCLYRPGDVQLGLNLLIVFCLFVLGCACVVVGSAFRSQESPRGWILPVCVVLSGWMANIYLIGNLDHLIALPLAVLLLAYCREPLRGRRGELALIFSALVFAYPDYALAASAPAGLLLLLRHGRRWRPGRGVAIGVPLVLAAIAAAIAMRPGPLLLTIAPRLRVLFPMKGDRLGGDTFSALTEWPTVLPAFWGTGVEFFPVRFTNQLLVLSAAWTIALGWALVGCCRRRDWSLLATLGVPLVAFGYLAFAVSYGYVAYKLLTLAWPFICLLLIGELLGPPGRVRRAVGGLVLISLVIVWQARFSVNRPVHVPCRGATCWREFRELESLKPQLAHAGTVLAVDDYFASMAAAYYLRDVPLLVGLPRHYMQIPFIQQLVERSPAPLAADIEYVVTDGSDRRSLITPASLRNQPVLANSAIAVWRLRRGWRLTTLSVSPTGPASGEWAKVTAVVLNRALSGIRIRGEVVPRSMLSSPDMPSVEIAIAGATVVRRLTDWAFDIELPSPPGLQEITISVRSGAGSLTPSMIRPSSVEFTSIDCSRRESSHRESTGRRPCPTAIR